MPRGIPKSTQPSATESPAPEAKSTSEYTVKVEYKHNKAPYAASESVFKTASLYRDGEFVVESEGPFLFDDDEGIRRWGVKMSLVDKLKRGELSSYKFTLGDDVADFIRGGNIDSFSIDGKDV